MVEPTFTSSQSPVIASKAKQSSETTLDCRVTPFLAMTFDGSNGHWPPPTAPLDCHFTLNRKKKSQEF
jgi:hypothetical protein